MARRLRIEFPFAVYHVTSRGDRREPIFGDDFDRCRLLEVLEEALHRFDARALAWCLMPNHYHLVLQTRQANLSKVMRHINGVYTQRFNRRRDTVGHLFQGRFHAVLIEADSHLLEVGRYVELNPVRAGLVPLPAQWGWSSYRAHAGLSPAPPWLDVEAVRGYMLGRQAICEADCREAAERYVALVASAVAAEPWYRRVRQGQYLGSDEFIAQATRTSPSAPIGNNAISSVTWPPATSTRAPGRS
jgi:REP element-mobilizing transposase RayT